MAGQQKRPRGEMNPQMPPSGIPLEKNAGLIMATNNSSIVSKRSVERLYYPKPHFFQHFVRKPQRRSPIINRGYWLRMQAIDSVVDEFIRRPAEKDKVIINLGCGYDPLPFKWLSKEPDLCRSVRFVDVDYRELMITKASIIGETAMLTDLVKPREATRPDLCIESKQYYGIGCDLRDLKSLELAVGSLEGLDKALVLCIAEVSVAYMDPDAADALIAWARKLSDDVTFAMLEQHLPDGPDHPFAQTMLKHFRKLNAPLRSIHKYSGQRSQRQRFYNCGWQAVKFVSLWELWSDLHFLAPSQRLWLDQVEPFDEWEEFALFATHYFLLTAHSQPMSLDKITGPGEIAKLDISAESPSAKTTPASDQVMEVHRLQYIHNLKSRGLRRHGVMFKMYDHYSDVPIAIAHHGGLTKEGRTWTTDMFEKAKAANSTLKGPSPKIAARQCHSCASMKNGHTILLGGRTSPAAAVKDCYLQTASTWEPIQDLPVPRFRHSVVPVTLANSAPGALVFGGKSGQDRMELDILLWDHTAGWRCLETVKGRVQPRFGATFVALGDDFGLLTGGMRADGVVFTDFWQWHLEFREQVVVGITFKPFRLKIDDGARPYFGRFGATHSLVKDQLWLIGGIASSGCIPEAYEVLSMDISGFSAPDREKAVHVDVFRVEYHRGADVSRPLFVGHSSIDAGENEVLIAGGGAVCFSFGTYWNSGLYILYDPSASSRLDWHMVESRNSGMTGEKEHTLGNELLQNTSEKGCVERIPLNSAAEFLSIVHDARPKILNDVDFGPCTALWARAYLFSKIGSERSVVVHEARGRSMNFQRKDFKYVTKPFGVFLNEIYNGGHQYLRSVSGSDPIKKAANLEADFPEIAGDFRLPSSLQLVTERYHSSPLRITGDVAMWLHVDTMANVLCQIRGSKKLLLFPPADMVRLDFPHGSTTSRLEIFKDGDPEDIRDVADTHPIEAILRQGEVLFIPPLWAHTAAPLESVSVAVNVFFRSLSTGYPAGKDVYGNRDLEAYENGRKDVAKIAKSFEEVPNDLAHTYLLRLADELASKAREYAPMS